MGWGGNSAIRFWGTGGKYRVNTLDLCDEIAAYVATQGRQEPVLFNEGTCSFTRAALALAVVHRGWAIWYSHVLLLEPVAAAWCVLQQHAPYQALCLPICDRPPALSRARRQRLA